MRIKLFNTFLSGVLCFSFVACSSNLTSTETNSLPLDSKQEFFNGGVWYNPLEKDIWTAAYQNIYVAPVDIAQVKKQYPQESELLATQFRKALQDDIRTSLQLKNKRTNGRYHWQLISSPTSDCLTLHISIVTLKATNVGGNIASDILGIVSPIPGTSLLLNALMKGDVGIKGKLVNTGTGVTIMEFKASADDPFSLFSIKEFERFGYDSRNIHLFAKRIAEVLNLGPKGHIPSISEIDWNPF